MFEGSLFGLGGWTQGFESLKFGIFRFDPAQTYVYKQYYINRFTILLIDGAASVVKQENAYMLWFLSARISRALLHNTRLVLVSCSSDTFWKFKETYTSLNNLDVLVDLNRRHEYNAYIAYNTSMHCICTGIIFRRFPSNISIALNKSVLC